MNFDRSDKRTSRVTRLDVESLGERIAPAHGGGLAAGGGVFLNLITEPVNGSHGFLVSETLNFEVQAIQNTRLNHPIIASGPVTIGTFGNNAITNSSNPLRLPVSKPPGIIVTAPVTVGFNAFTVPVSKPPGIIVTAPVTFTVNPPPTPPTPPAPPAPVGAPANLASSLLALYNQYEANPSDFTGTTTYTNADGLTINGDTVGISVHDSSMADFPNALSGLNTLGLTNSDPSPAYDLVVGMLPISELVAAARLSPTLSVNPEGEMSLN